MKLLRPRPAAAVKEKRLAELLGGRAPADEPRLRAAVEDAYLLGSLQLAGCEVSWDDVQAQRRGEPAPPAVAALRRAFDALRPDAAFSVELLRAWHAATLDVPSAWRRGQRERAGGPPTAPPERIAERVESLAGWLGAPSAGELGPEQAAALVLARLVEIAPFDDGNGRVARLAAAHAMLGRGARLPIFAPGDRGRIEAALQAAFQLHTEPLAALLEEAAERPLDVMLQTLTGRA